jgi:hypothetical protein
MVDADMRLEGLDPIGDGDAIVFDKFHKNKWWLND